MEVKEKLSDPMLRGYRISVSFSCPGEMYSEIQTYRIGNRWNMSQAITRLIRLGMTYTKLLQQQEAMKQSKLVESAKKKKRKRKTPSKKG